MGAGERDLDIVIYGATGFVGKLTAQYLSTAAAGVRVALAGRSADRLHAVRDTLGAGAADWPVIAADLSQQEALNDMAARTQVVVSAVGPYTRNGLPLVAACATSGTGYADLTGEVTFVRDSIDLYHKRAVETGARIVHSCGFDAIPSDFTVYALHRRAVEDDAGELADTTMVLREYSGGVSRGTAATMLDVLRTASGDAATRRLLDDPYGLSPNRSAEPELGSQPDLTLRAGAEIAPELSGLWTTGWHVGMYNTRCVRRSNALLDWAYGRGLRYTEAMSMGSSFAAPVMAATVNAGITTAYRLGGRYLRLLPDQLVERVTAMPGSGQNESSRGFYKVETYTTTTTGARYVATIAQQADPGYTATAIMLGQSALSLAMDRDKLPDRRGVLTPVTAMGDALPARLSAAGVTIDVARLPMDRQGM
jgi:short subunit dehydrogenase-like uncharacterized protein